MQQEPDLTLWNTPFVQDHMARALLQGGEWYQISTEGMLRANLQYMPLGSPLEAAFLAWWIVLSNARAYSFDVKLRAQEKVTIGKRTLRLDFEIVPQDDGLFPRAARNHLEVQRIGVELDGHDYHERTREQVTRRNKRDRSLQSTGWRVFHFSGSEFNRDPVACVDAVYADASYAFWDLGQRVWAIERDREQPS
jgi:hypothetical protein